MKLFSSLKLKKRTFSFVAVVVALAVLFSFVTSGIILSFAADNSELYDFEKSGVTYIPKVQTKTYSTESKCSATVTTDKAATGTHSLHITTASGAAEAQYFFFGSSFNPQAGKWMNIKALVPQGSGTDIAALFYKQENGQIKICDYYYFSQTANPTDGVRSRDKWVNLSFQVPSGVSLREVGIYLTSFGSANDNADIYIDSYSVTDKATDTDRYVDMDSIDVRRSFEGGGSSDYIEKVQTVSWSTESSYVAAVTDEHASKGKKSFCISTKSGAAKGQYFYLKTDTFMSTAGKWMNLKVFVSENKGPDYLSLFYKQSNGVISTGDLYYFADDISNPVTTDEIRKKNEWVTISLFVPETANVINCGVYTGTFGSSNDTACFYIDDFTVTDSALDTVRYLDLNDPGVKSGFESGSGGDYIEKVQTDSFAQEKSYLTAISGEQAAEGKKSLQIRTTSGAAKMQYFFMTSFFRPDTSKSDKWVNMKVFVDEGSDLSSVRIFWQGYTGPIYFSEYYYFADNKESPVITDSIRSKGKWVNISMKIGKGTEMKSFGIATESFKASNDNGKLFLDCYTVDDFAADTTRYSDINNPAVRYGFESGTKSEYISQVQTGKWEQEKCYNAAITTANAAEGSKSLCITTFAGAAKEQYFFMPESFFLPEVNRWVNIKVYVEPGKGPDYIRLFYKDAAGPVVTSEYYYFADNPSSPVATDEIRKCGEWVTLSHLMPSGAKPLRFGVNCGTFGESNNNSKFYVDSYSITDVALDDTRYLDMNNPQVKSSFESGTGGDYIEKVQTKSFSQEKCYSASVTSEQAAEGKKSLLIKTTSGADQMQYFFMTSFFRPDTSKSGKWVNMKVFVVNETDLAALRLFYQGNSGPIYFSEYYYFADNKESPVVTDAIRDKGKWINVSMYISKGTEMKSFGIATESFKEHNDNGKVFIDAYSVDDFAADTIRYSDINNPTVRYGFESGTKNEYISQVQTNKWEQEKNYSAAITSNKAADGKKSLCVTTFKGAAKEQYIFMPESFFMPKVGKWVNLKVYVEPGNGPDYIRLFYKDAAGPVVTSEYYYFADNKESPVMTDEIRKCGEWITISHFMPSGAKPLRFGVNCGTFGESNDNCKFYIDSYSITDTALDSIRYANMNDPKVKANFESGTAADYITQVQTNSFAQEKYTAAITTEKAQSGKKSLKLATGSSAAKAQYIVLSSFFKPQPGQWANLRVYVPKGSEPNAISFFYQGDSGPIYYGESYYFDDNPKDKVMTDEIRKKDGWVTISTQIPSNTYVKKFGIYMEAFDGSNNAVIYIDNFTFTNKPEDSIRYGAAAPKGNTLIDFETGASTDYLFVVQNDKWRQPKAQKAAVTSYRAADGKRSLYYKNDNSDDKCVYIYFPTKYNPPKGKFLNIKVFVDKENKGLDYAKLVYLENSGTISAGPTFYFANNKENTIEAKDIYKKGEWITLSMYIAKSADVRRVGIQFGSNGNNGTNKEIFIDTFTYSTEPLDKSHDYFLKPLIEIPDNFSGSIKRIAVTPDTLGMGINVSTGEKVKTTAGTVDVENLILNAEEITEGDIFNKAKASSGKEAIALYKLSLTYENKEVNIAENIKLLLNVPKGIDETTAGVYSVNNDGSAKLLTSERNNEILSVNVDKIGYVMVAGDKAPEVKLMFNKVIKTGTKKPNRQQMALIQHSLF